MGQGTSKESRIVLIMFKKSTLLPHGSTLNTIFRVTPWSLNALLGGKTPVLSMCLKPYPRRQGEDVVSTGGGGQKLHPQGAWSLVQ